MVVVRAPQGSSLLSKVRARLRWLRLSYVVSARLLKKGRVDVLQSRDDWMAGLVALLLAKRHRLPFVFQYSFPFAQWRKVLYRQLHGVWGGLAAEFEARMFHFVMRRVDLLLPISDKMAADLRRENVNPPMRVTPLAANVERAASEADGMRIRSALGLEEAQVVLYVGTMAQERGLELLVRAFATVADRIPEARLLMVGDGGARADLCHLASTLGVREAVVFTGEVPYDDVPAYIASCDVAVSPVPPLDIYTLSSPIKLFEYMAAGKAVVANQEILEHKNVLESSNAGLLTPFAADGFATAVCALLDDRSSRQKMGDRGRQWVQEKRSFASLASMLVEEYEKLIACGTAAQVRSE